MGQSLWTAQGRAAWQHEYLNGSRSLTAGFDQAALGTFTVQTTAPKRDAALLGAGLSAQFTPTLGLSLNYDVEAQSGFFAQRIQGGATVRF
jgi:outer membrane autotransporter protein